MATAAAIHDTQRDDGPAAEATILLSKLYTLQAMIETKNRALFDELWGDGGFHLVGSERGEICLTRERVAAKIEAILSNPATLIFEFPNKHISIVGNAGWIFAEGVLRRRDPAGLEEVRDYLATCIFEKVEGVWRWRQFFGSEPY
ncbi:hypothetical protein ABID16_003135 [Rhizobium aquaticum]|uniref:SnoaL-like domain-containing protein n=1 Tax=Rhizobium aquaticum TaxID=1549636 RepID=A0ABV2J204_9HYPH